MIVKDVIKRLVLGYKASSKAYVNHLKKIGMDIGEDVIFFRPFNTTIDEQNPYLISIGNHVMVTGPVTILSHDYSWSVLKGKYGDILGNQKRTIIGNNIFIGWGTTILGGSVIGDNVIIGANAVVSGRIESDSVYAGNPAKRMMSIDEYYTKRKKNQLTEAVAVVNRFVDVYGYEPPLEALNEYFFLFATEDEICPSFESQLALLGNKELSLKRIKDSRLFYGYKDFLRYCREKR